MTMRSTEDLIRIISAGGGMEVDLGMRPVEDVIRIAAAASLKPGTRLVLDGMQMRTVEDLIRIAAAGKGAVVFRGL